MKAKLRFKLGDFIIGQEYESEYDFDVNQYNIFYQNEHIYSLKPESFFHYFSVNRKEEEKRLVIEKKKYERRKKLERVLYQKQQN